MRPYVLMLLIGIIGSCFPPPQQLRGPRQYWWKFSAYIFYQFKYNLQSWNLHKSQIGKNKLGICWFASSLLTPGLHTAALTAARGDNLQINCRTHIHISVISQTWLTLSTFLYHNSCLFYQLFLWISYFK